MRLDDASSDPYWLDRAWPTEAPPLEDSVEADLAIVGGGFTGLWAAVQAKQERPEREVVLRVDRADIAGNAPGTAGAADPSLPRPSAVDVRPSATVTWLPHTLAAMFVRPGVILLSEVIGALSYALDITEGEPPGHAQRSCLIGMRLAQELRLDAETRSDVFYALLLKDAGCTANAARMAALFGADDHELKRSAKRVDWSRKLPAFVWSVRSVAPNESPRVKLERLLTIKDEGEVTRSLMQARCDRGAEVARLIGLTEGTAEAIRTLDEHWDGHGHPRRLAGDQIPLLGRILCLAQTVEIFHAKGGIDDACAVARRRSGSWFDPDLVKALEAFRGDASFWASLTEPDLTRWEPEDQVIEVDADRLLRIASAFAAIVDAKSQWTYFHSDRTSLIATNMGAALGLDAEAVDDLRRVSLLHDIGKLAVSNRILDKPAALTDAEFARVKEHPLFTQWVLERMSAFEEVAAVGAAHHERLDGSGYPRGLHGDDLTLPMRVLAVADVYEALTAERPYRHALAEEQALDIIRRDVPRRLDGDAYEALEAVMDRS